MPPTGGDINREVIIYEPPWIFMSIKFRIHTHTGTTVMQTACNIIVMTIVGYVRYRVVLGNNLAS